MSEISPGDKVQVTFTGVVTTVTDDMVRVGSARFYGGGRFDRDQVRPGPTAARIVTTSAQLDELPVGAVIRDSDGRLCEKSPRWWRLMGSTALLQQPNGRYPIPLPATIIDVPEGPK